MWLSRPASYVISSAKLRTLKFTTESRSFPATARLSCLYIRPQIVRPDYTQISWSLILSRRQARYNGTFGNKGPPATKAKPGAAD